jgi:hypothetical protein
MASSSDTRSTRIWLEDTHVALRRPRSAQANNERITFVSALNQRNKEDTMSSYSDHQQLQERRPKQSPYMKGIGMSLNMIVPQDDLTLKSNNSTYTNSMVSVSHQTTSKDLIPQMKNQLHLDLNQTAPVKRNSHNDTHLQLKQQLRHQQRQEPLMLTTEENPENYHSQTHTTLALLLLAKNNN